MSRRRVTSILSTFPQAAAWLALAIAVGLSSGCGGKKNDKPKLKLYAVKATLTMDGQPYGPAQLTLFSVDRKEGPWTMAVADDKGVLKFKTYTKLGDGVPAGEYKVAVIDFPGSKPVPQIYRTEQKTNYKVKIEPKKNTLTIDLNSKADEIAEAEEMDRQGFEKDKNGKWVPKRKK